MRSNVKTCAEVRCPHYCHVLQFSCSQLPNCFGQTGPDAEEVEESDSKDGHGQLCDASAVEIGFAGVAPSVISN